MFNEYFSYFISTLIFLSPIYFKRKHDISSMSSLTTTLGIFGTFLGIFLGLIGFDVNNLQSSVPQLLNGLKIAFLTSISGMLASIILKEKPSFYGIKTDVVDTTNEQSVVEHVVNLLSMIEKNQKELFLQENQQLVKIEKALCGEGETTLLTQIQKLRTSFSDKQDELIESFNDFSRKLADDNSKVLIDALTQVMKDFNIKINEQFGDNFQRLNEAVGKILEWQQEYGKQVDLMVGQIQTTASAVEQSSKTLETIINGTKTFTTTALSLSQLINAINQTQNDLENKLKAFEQLASNAKNTFPIIDEQLKKLTNDFSKTVERTISDSKNIVNIQLDTTKNLSSQIMDAQRGLGTSLTELVNKLNINVERMMKDNAERISKQVAELDKQLGDELTKSLQTMGSQLASLSKKFVTDYTPLTENLKNLIEVSKNNLR